MGSAGAVLAALQLAFALTWVIYVIYLPALAVQAGLPKHLVPWVLLMDQVVFIACDWSAGVYADRVAARLERIGPRIALVTLASGGAFLLLPWLAPAGSPALFVALTIAWSATSSALRAPALVLIGRHAAPPQRPWLAALYLLGLGIAGALAPYLGSALRNVDPRIPFALSTLAVVALTFAFAAAERRGTAPPSEATAQQGAPAPSAARAAAFAAAIALFAFGFQVHFSVNSAPGYLRFAPPAQLEHLMPVFWVGFNLMMLPATLLAKRHGGVPVMAAAGCAGVVFAMGAGLASSLEALLAMQFALGGAWGVVLMSGFTAALEIGRPGREGSVTGMLFSMLAVAAFARIAFVVAELPKAAPIAPALAAIPSLAWGMASLLVLILAWKRSV